MNTVIFVVLFILQLISFYCIVLLNSKITKFKDIEVKQEQIIRDMDDAIGAYLMEMKDENDRLIKELSERKVEIKYITNEPEATAKSQAAPNEGAVEQLSTASSTLSKNQMTLTQDMDVNNIIALNQTEEIQPSQSMAIPIAIPKKIATNAYKKQNSVAASTKKVSEDVVEDVKPVDQVLKTFEQEVVQYYKSGLTIEEIAKKTQKGKTEIELLIKFHA